MDNFYTGINSRTFLECYSFREGEHIFDKSRTEMDDSGLIYLVKNPLVFPSHEHLNMFVVMNKRAVRQAIFLSHMHGGYPLVLKIRPDEKSLRYNNVRRHTFSDLSQAKILKLYGVSDAFTFGSVDIAYRISEITLESVLKHEYEPVEGRWMQKEFLDRFI